MERQSAAIRYFLAPQLELRVTEAAASSCSVELKRTRACGESPVLLLPTISQMELAVAPDWD